MTASAKIETPARLVGRPRRLTLEQLLDAAIEGGLQDLNMKELAARLGVGIATLYRYVDNRETLIRLATGRQASRKAPSDTGQSWQALAREFAESLHEVLCTNPHLISGFVEAQWGIGVELEAVDAFLGAMAARGFSAREALELYRQIGQVAIGAATAKAHFASLVARGVDERHELAAALAEWDADELRHLRAASETYVAHHSVDDLGALADIVIADFARRHGRDG